MPTKPEGPAQESRLKCKGCGATFRADLVGAGIACTICDGDEWEPEGPTQEPQGGPLGKWYCPKHKLRITDAYSCPECFEPVVPATPAPAAHTEPHGAFFQPHVIPKVKGCPDCEAMAKRVTVLGQTRPENVGLTPLMEMCDREWSDETPEQVIAIAANAIYWRNREIQKLREHSAPSQPAGVREFNEYMGAELFRAQRDWLIAECARVGVTVNVIIGAPLEKAYRLDNAAERERDSYKEDNDEAYRQLGLEDYEGEDGLAHHIAVLQAQNAALKAGKDGQQ